MSLGMARMWSTPQWILDGVEVGVLVIILLRVLMRRIGGGDEEGQFRYVDRLFSVKEADRPGLMPL